VLHQFSQFCNDVSSCYNKPNQENDMLKQNATIANNSAVISIIQQRITALLNDLPLESLQLLEQFVQFLSQKAHSKRPSVPYHYPTVEIEPATVDGLVGIMPKTYTGDALVDTESLYDEV
jgi:hypothetical protein